MSSKKRKKAGGRARSRAARPGRTKSAKASRAKEKARSSSSRTSKASPGRSSAAHTAARTRLRERTPGGARARAPSAVARISVAGGPVLVTSVSDFLRWRGEREDVEGRIVKFYGSIVSRLPPWLLPRGAHSFHQSIEVPTAIEADRFLERLRAALAALEPNVVEQARRALTESEILAKANEAMRAGGAGMKAWLAAWRQSVEQGLDFLVGAERVLHVHVDAATDYDRGREAIADPAAKGAALISWSGTARGALADLGAERVRVHLGRDGREIRIAPADADAGPAGGETTLGEMVLADGFAIVIWAPVDLAALDGVSAEPGAWLASIAARPGDDHAVTLSTAQDASVGVVLRVEPGRWMATCGSGRLQLTRLSA